MLLENLKIGYALTGSFCTLSNSLRRLELLAAEGADIYPILSKNAAEIDTRFMSAADLRAKLTEITGKEPFTTIAQAEPIGPKAFLDVLIISPCTGNTLAKIANGITDTSVAMAFKAHLRNNKPVVIAIATNDGLGANAKNLGLLMNTKHVFFVPFGQDDPVKKSNSLVADLDLMIPSVLEALQGRQLQPVLIKQAAP